MYKYLIIILLGGITYTQCNDFLESQCITDSNCDWIENFSYGSCSNLSWQVCNNYEGCYVDSELGWYDSSGPYCTGGTYQIDNSYCQEIEIVECSEMNEIECSNNSICEWIDNIEYGNCSNYNTGATCDANENCFWDLCYGGYYGSWSHCCRGGTYQVNNSYCEELTYIPGDINGDGNLNIADVILMVNLILNYNFNEYADMNQDSILNIIDIIELVNRILEI